VEVSFDDQFNPWEKSRTAQLSFSYAASALLAMKHFNERDDYVVPEIADLDPNCTVYFPDPTFADSKSDGTVSTKAFWDSVAANTTDRPCAMLGPLEEQTNFQLQPALSALDIPMLVYYVESDLLASSDAAGTVSATLTATGRARAMVEFLQDREFLANWYPFLDQETFLAQELERIGQQFGLKVLLFMERTAPAGDQDAFTRQNLQKIKESGITTVFLSLREPFEAPRLAAFLDELGMLSNEYLYILPPSVVVFNSMVDIYGEQTPNSSLDKLLSGTCVNRLRTREDSACQFSILFPRLLTVPFYDFQVPLHLTNWIYLMLSRTKTRTPFYRLGGNRARLL